MRMRHARSSWVCVLWRKFGGTRRCRCRFRNGLARELDCFKACRISKVHARSHEITKEPCTSWKYENTDKKQITMLRRITRMLKNQRIVVSRTWKMGQTTCNWIKRILNEATWITFIRFYPEAGKCFQKARHLAVWNHYIIPRNNSLNS